MDSSFQFFYIFFIIVFLTSQVIYSHHGPNTSISLSIRKRHDQWMTQHGRKYESVSEKEYRLGVFRKNMKYIEKFNNESANKSYKLALNGFSDLTEKEFFEAYTGLKVPSSPLMNSSSFVTKNSNKVYIINSLIPTVDWRNKGVVTPVRTQGGCGACWAFAAVAAIEGIINIKTQTLNSFSEQNLIDCDESNSGCDGGAVITAFGYVNSEGVESEQDYPYVGKRTNCNAAQAKFNITGYEFVQPADDPAALMSAVDRQPVAINIDAGGFRHYSGGVYDGGCTTELNHALTVIGYGTDEGTSKNYWLAKNSWGDSWGEDGYIRILMDESVCHVTSFASYPTLD